MFYQNFLFSCFVLVRKVERQERKLGGEKGCIYSYRWGGYLKRGSSVKEQYEYENGRQIFQVIKKENCCFSLPSKMTQFSNSSKNYTANQIPLF